MIAEALVFLKNQLNTYIKTSANVVDPQPDQVDFIKGDQLDPLNFNVGGISILLINVEQDNRFRAADPYRQAVSDKQFQAVKPEIPLNLSVLFVARYPDYQDALRNLSLIIQFFQGHRIFKHPDAVGLNENIEQLAVEMVTLPFAEQNEIWNALRTTYHPSVLYKVKMVIFRSETPVEVGVIEHKPEITFKHPPFQKDVPKKN